MDKRIFIILCIITLFLLAVQEIDAKVFPGKDWLKVTPQSQGIDSAKLQEAVSYLSEQIKAKNSYTGGLLIVRNGYVIWENEESYKLWCVMSVSKSFLSTALGLMIEDGKVKLSTPVKDCDPRISNYYPNATMKHFATMTSGYDAKPIPLHAPGYDCDTKGKCDTWDPGIPLEPLFEAGTKYRYWDEAEIEMGYALTLIGGDPDYVINLLRERIASPIGMQNFSWRNVETTVGKLPVMNGGLITNARDLARFGLLFLNRGNWNGKQLISSSWVDEATSVQVPSSIPNDETNRAYGSGAYGYNWWINGITPNGKRFLPGADPSTYWASGFGTNKCYVIPAWDMVIVRTGGIPQDWKEANAVFDTFLEMVGKAIKSR